MACSKSWPQIIERRLQDRPFELEAEGSTRSGRRRGAINRSDMAQAIPDLPEFEAGRDLCWVAILRTAKRGEPPYVQAAMLADAAVSPSPRDCTECFQGCCPRQGVRGGSAVIELSDADKIVIQPVLKLAIYTDRRDRSVVVVHVVTEDGHNFLKMTPDDLLAFGTRMISSPSIPG